MKERGYMTYEEVRRVVDGSGMWDGTRGRTHAFTLSPSVFEVSLERRDELGGIAEALGDCLAGLGRIAAIATRPEFNHSTAWGMFERAFRVGIPHAYREIMVLKPSGVPSICKVDFMESTDGKLWIAEIDGHNKHGLGYSTLAAHIRAALVPDATVFPGVAHMLAQEIRRREESSALLLYGDEERFYLPEFQVLQNELKTRGVELLVCAESDVHVGEDGTMTLGSDEREPRLLVDLPLMYHNSLLIKLLPQRYRDGKIDFLIPPKPFLGSKVVLALLRNDEENDVLEAILRSQIPGRSLETVRQHIPVTYLVHRRRREQYWRDLCGGKPFVLKESVSSGMKGVAFSGTERFDAMMAQACASYYRFILQEEMENNPREFDHFTEDGTIQTGQWFTRITVHFAARRVADIVVTARQDKAVHGAPDALQLGVVIE